jgi:hypothetical protein
MVRAVSALIPAMIRAELALIRSVFSMGQTATAVRHKDRTRRATRGISTQSGSALGQAPGGRWRWALYAANHKTIADFGESYINTQDS